jgi:hypothetical protein
MSLRTATRTGRAARLACAVATVAAVTAAGCDRSPLGGSDLDMEALEALGGPTAAGRSVVSGLIDVATRLQAEDEAVPDVALPTLAQLFEGALSVDAEENGPESALGLKTGHTVLLDSAWTRIGNGDDGDEILAEARGYQAATIARVLGRSTSMAYVFLVGRTLERVNVGLLRLRGQGEDVRHFQRMTDSARELEHNAREALGNGDTGRALDIGGHAADLVNTVIGEIRAR